MNGYMSWTADLRRAKRGTRVFGDTVKMSFENCYLVNRAPRVSLFRSLRYVDGAALCRSTLLAAMVATTLLVGTQQSVAQTTSPNVDIKEPGDYFWNTVKNSQSAEDYELYIFAYPKGRFVSAAKKRAAELRVANPEPEPNDWAVSEMDAPFTVGAVTSMRKTPEPTGAHVLSLKPGDSVVVTGKVVDSAWYRVEAADGTEGFVGEEFLTAQATQAEVLQESAKVASEEPKLPVAVPVATAEPAPVSKIETPATVVTSTSVTPETMPKTAAPAPQVPAVTAVVAKPAVESTAALTPPARVSSLESASPSVLTDSESAPQEPAAAQPTATVSTESQVASTPAVVPTPTPVATPAPTPVVTSTPVATTLLTTAASAPLATTVPPAAPLTANENARLDALFRAAARDIRANRLTTPARNNALARLDQARLLAPDDARLEAAMRVIVERYTGLIRSSAARGNRGRALDYLKRAREVMPESSLLDTVQSELGSN